MGYLNRLVCRVRGHDWREHASYPQWHLVEPVYFVSPGEEVQLAGWMLYEECRRCGEMRQRSLTESARTFSWKVQSTFVKVVSPPEQEWRPSPEEYARWK